MSNPRRIAGLVLLILLTSLIHWPTGQALTPQDQTIWITDTHDDLFITETGIGIDSQLCHVLDPTMDIRSFLVFRGLEINWWEPLENASLRFRTTATLDFDANSTVTVYGMRYSDLQREGWLYPGWVLSVPLTSAHVDMNTSQFYGQTWHEVNVTNIVEELIISYDWDGDGHAGTETGDAIGFIIMGAEGYDTRWFIDYLYGTPSLAPQLVIHWNHEPPPPVDIPGSPTFNSTHLGNWTIWTTWGYEILTEEYYTWANPGDVISLVNDYLVDLDSYGWDTWYPNGYQEHFLERKEDFDRYTESIEIRFYSKIVQEYVVGIRPDWEVIRLEDPDDTDTCGFFHYIDPETSSGAHQYHFQMNEMLYVNTISYTSTGDEWWTSFKRNSTKIYMDTYDGLDEPDWGVDVPDQSDDNALVSDGNFTESFRIGQSKTLPASSGKTDYRIGYFTILLDDVLPDIVWWGHDEDNNETYGPFDDYDDVTDFIETGDPDPEDPDPGGEWSTGPGGETGAFTRFRMRLWFMLIGFGCLFGPLIFFAWRRPSGYYIICGAIVMLIGIGLLLSIGQV